MNGTKYSLADCFVSMIKKPFAQRFVIIPWWVKTCSKKQQQQKKPHQTPKTKQGRVQILNLQKRW